VLEREILSDTSVQACTSCLEQVHSAIRVHANRHLLRPKVSEPPMEPPSLDVRMMRCCYLRAMRHEGHAWHGGSIANAQRSS
jgi:hypothetical protein